MNTRSVGKKLELYVADKLNEVFNCSDIRPTNNSGASTQLADILCKWLLVECKKRNTKNITINEDVWNKLISELPISSKRIPLYVLENQNNKRWAVMDLEDLCRLMARAWNACGEIQ